MMVATGLLLILAATAGPLPAPAGDAGAKVVIRLPDAVRVLLLGLSASASAEAAPLCYRHCRDLASGRLR